MKKITLILFILTGLLIGANGQVGFKFGYGPSKLSSNNDPAITYSYLQGFQAGITTNLKIDRPGIYAEFLYSRKGFQYDYAYENSFDVPQVGMYYYKVNTTYTDRFHYFEMPLLFTYPIIENRLIVEMGPNFGVNISGKRVGKTVIASKNTLFTNYEYEYEYSEDAKFNDKEKFPNPRGENDSFFLSSSSDVDKEELPARRIYTLFDIGLNIGIQVKIINELSLGIRYNYGLIDVKNNHYPNRNTDMSHEAFRSLQTFLVIFIE